MRLRILSLNIHKGLSAFSNRSIISELRDTLRASKADIVCLQEVAFRNAVQQSEYLADEVWSDHAYGKNSAYDAGHHGNAILSKTPIQKSMNTDISSSILEKRGFLYALTEIHSRPLHLICLHLSLRSKDRKHQAVSLRDFVQSLPANEPLILAGDFNDWNLEMRSWLEAPLRLNEVFRSISGIEAKTFPSFLPLLRLDRIYTRGFKTLNVGTLSGRRRFRFSDHSAIWADLEE